MRLSEKENWKSFTALVPRILLKRATAMRLGWAQVSARLDVPESEPHPELPVAGGPNVVLSCTYLNISLNDFGRLTSPRILSLRKLLFWLNCFEKVVSEA